MKVKEFMEETEITLRRNQSLKEAARIFVEEGRHILPVVDEDGNFLGILRKMDLIWPFIPFYEGEPLNPGSLSDEDARLYLVEDVMEWDVPTVSPDDDIAKAAALLGKEGFESIPVVEEGKFLGIITTTAICRAFFFP